MKTTRTISIACLLAFLLLPTLLANAQEPVTEGLIDGVIFIDANENGVFDIEESGVPGVEFIFTSNSVQFVLTSDENGAFSSNVTLENWEISATLPENIESISLNPQMVTLSTESSVISLVFALRDLTPSEEDQDENTEISDPEDATPEEITDEEEEIPLEATEGVEGVNAPGSGSDPDGMEILPESGAVIPLPILLGTILIVLIAIGLLLIRFEKRTQHK